MKAFCLKKKWVKSCFKLKKHLILLLIIFLSCSSPESLEEAPVAEETEAEETEEEVSEESETVDVEEEEDSEPESEVAEDEVEEVVELEEVDAEFEALFAEAQATIADSYVAELEEDEEV